MYYMLYRLTKDTLILWTKTIHGEAAYVMAIVGCSLDAPECTFISKELLKIYSISDAVCCRIKYK